MRRRLYCSLLLIITLTAGPGAWTEDGKDEPEKRYTIAAPDKYKKNIEKTIRWVASQYDEDFRMLRGCRVGGEGLQPGGFSIINENQFGGNALAPYEKELSERILERVGFYLEKLNYKWNGRREVMFGRDIPLPVRNSHGVVEIEGARKSHGGKYWIVTELPKDPLPLSVVERNLSHMVPTLLQQYRNGNMKEAQRLYDLCLKMWTGTGFLDGGAKRKSKYYTRGLCYFLYARRATGFKTDPKILDTIEERLWKNQDDDGSIRTVYSLKGEPRGHTSLEICSLAILIYDARVKGEWYRQEAMKPARPHETPR